MCFPHGGGPHTGSARGSPFTVDSFQYYDVLLSKTTVLKDEVRCVRAVWRRSPRRRLAPSSRTGQLSGGRTTLSLSTGSLQFITCPDLGALKFWVLFPSSSRLAPSDIIQSKTVWSRPWLRTVGSRAWGAQCGPPSSAAATTGWGEAAAPGPRPPGAPSSAAPADPPPRDIFLERARVPARSSQSRTSLRSGLQRGRDVSVSRRPSRKLPEKKRILL